MDSVTRQKTRLSSTRRIIQGLCLVGIAILLSFLTGCGMLAQQPPTQAVKLAVTQQLTNAQQNIAQSLGRSEASTLEPNFKINKLDITSREKVSDKRFQTKGYPSDIYKVRGTIDTTLTAASRKIQQTSPFELYLGTNDLKKTDRKKTSNTAAQAESNSIDSVETWYLIAPDVPKPLQ